MEEKTGESGVWFEFKLKTIWDKKRVMDMPKQKEVVQKFFHQLMEQQGQSPQELPPRDGEKYRFAWGMEGDEGKSYYELFQMGDCLYLTADTETLADNDEFKMLQLLNWLNGWSHYGIFTYASDAPEGKRVSYEQTHFCRFFEYTVAEIEDFYHQMIKRMSVYYLSADSVFNNGTNIEIAVDTANNVVRKLKN